MKQHITNITQFQIGIFAALCFVILILILRKWNWIIETYQIVAELVSWGLWAIRALAFGYGSYALFALVVNMNEIKSWHRLICILTFDVERPWVSSATLIGNGIGMLIAFYAWAGGFTGTSESVTPFRGRRLISAAEAKRRLNKSLGRPDEKPPGRWRMIQFRLFLMRRAFVSVFGKDGLSRPAAPESARSRSQPTEGICWGNLMLPVSTAATHFGVVGSSGSGKGLTQRMLAQSVLPKLGSKENGRFGKRAVVFDPKQDMHSIIHGMGIHLPVITLNPFDSRSPAWDLSADVISPAAARSIATILVPEEKESVNKFFSESACTLLAATMIALDEVAPGKWTLRDVLLATHSATVLEVLLRKSGEAWQMAVLYFQDKKTLPGIMSSVATKLAHFRVVASLWLNKPTFSLTQWLKSESILILGYHAGYHSSIMPINQAFLERLTQLILSGPEVKSPTTWLFLDELRALGTVPSLPRFLTMGRSKGGCAVVGFQAIEGLRELYGQNVPDEMFGQISNRTYLRNVSSITAEWVSRNFGTYETYEASFSESTSTSSQGTNRSSSVSYNVVARQAVLPSEIMSIPQTCDEHGLTAFHDIAFVGSYSTHLNSKELEERLMEPDKDVSDFDPVDQKTQKLESWTPAELIKFGIDPSCMDTIKQEQTKENLFEELPMTKLEDIRRDDT